MTQFYSTTTDPMVSSADSEGYRGVIQESRRKILQKRVYDYYAYMLLHTPQCKIYMTIISIWRLLQVVIPSFFVGCLSLYSTNTGIVFSNVLSFFTGLTPIGLGNSNFIAISCLYFIVNIIFLFFFVYSSFHFYKTNKTNRTIMLIHYFYLQGPFLLLHPILSTQIGLEISSKFIEVHNYSNALTWVFLVLDIIFLAFLLYAHHSFVSITMPFSNTSLKTFLPQLQFSVLAFTCVLSLLSSAISNLVELGERIVGIIVGVGYLSMFFIDRAFPRFIGLSISCHFKSVLLLSSIITIGNVITVFMKKPASSIFYILLIFIYIILFTIFYIIEKHYTSKVLLLLDDFSIDPEQFTELFKTNYSILVSATTAFEYGHPALINWQFMRTATDLQPDNLNAWLLWARFATSYTGDDRILAWLGDRIGGLPTHSFQTRCARAQLHALLKYRSTVTMPVVKRRITNAKRLMNQAQKSITSFWECVLQGSLNDVEISNNAAQEAWADANNDLLNIIDTYPNSLYAVQLYIRFLTVTQSNPTELKNWTAKYRQAKSGHQITEDAAQLLAVKTFPNMIRVVYPKSYVDQSMFPTNKKIDTMMLASESEELTARSEDEDFIKDSIYSSITDMKTPVITNSIIVFIFFAVIVYVIIVPVGFVFIYNRAAMFEGYMMCSGNAANLGSSIASLCLTSLRKIIELIEIEPDLVDMETELSFKECQYSWMKDLDLKNEIIKEFNRTDNFLNELREISSLSKNENQKNRAYLIVFKGVYYVRWMEGTYDDYRYTESLGSVESLTVPLYVSSMEICELLTSQSALDILIKSVEFQNMNIARVSAASQIDEVAVLVYSTLLEASTNYMNTLWLVFVIFTSALAVLIVLFLLVSIHKIRTEIKNINRCYLLLPKHIINNVVISFKNEKGNVDLDEQKMGEDALISSLSTNNMSKRGVTSSVAYYAIALIAFLVFSIILLVILYFEVVKMSKIPGGYTPIAISFSRLYAIAANLVYDLYTIGMIDSKIDVLGEERANITKRVELQYQVYMKTLYRIIFGNEETGMKALTLIDDNIASFAMIDNVDDCSADMHEAYKRMPFIGQFFILGNMLSLVIMEALESNVDVGNGEMMQITHILEHHIKSTIRPIMDEMTEAAAKKSGSILLIVTLVTSLFYIIVIISSVMTIYGLFHLKFHIKRLAIPLSMCPSEAILSSRSIFEMLSGSSGSTEKSTKIYHQGNFFDKVVYNSETIAVIQTDTRMVIKSTNTGASKLFPNAQPGMSLQQILPDSMSSFYEDVENAKLGRRAFDFTGIMQIEDRYFTITTVARTKNGYIDPSITAVVPITSLVFSIYDTSDYIKAKKAYAEEEQRMNEILQSLIPKEVVALAAKSPGERVTLNLTSATIVYITATSDFSDLSMASNIMKGVQAAFHSFAESLEKYPALVHVSSFNNTFVAAGGVFNEKGVSPEEHAKEAVQFALECIRESKNIEMRLNTRLQLRVGINTGGPVIAGTIEIDRPYFDIHGAAVSVAAQVVKSADTNTVLITRHVYELIFGPSFVVRENKGLLLNDGSKVITYNVIK